MFEVLHTAQYRGGGGSEKNTDHGYFTAGEIAHTFSIMLNLLTSPCLSDVVLLFVFVALTTTRKSSWKSLPSEWSSLPFGH